MPTAITRPLTLGRLARQTGLARSSLLHYESLGLLKPLKRSASGYRLYGESEIQRLESIRRFRHAGLSLETIRELLAPQPRTKSGAPAQLLERRLFALSEEMERLREQQRQLARLLALPKFREGKFASTKSAWVAMLARAGMSESDMREWHRRFELETPAEHAKFLRSLGIASSEVASIRRWSRVANEKS